MEVCTFCMYKAQSHGYRKSVRLKITAPQRYTVMYEAKTLSYLIGSQAPLPSTTSVGSEVHDVTGSPSPNFSMTSSDVADALNDVYFWVILAFGFPGNLLAFGTILTMKPRLRFTVYVAALALVDNVCLAIKVVYFNLNSYQVDIGDVGCQLMQYFGTFTGQWANWLLVMMTTERLVDFTMPLLSRRINKR
ncbi:rhodopsin [Biomphalaria glabrata]|nr:rhodopsin-like; partial [Biomphalaria glabrata]